MHNTKHVLSKDEQEFYDTREWGVEYPYHREVLADILAILPDDAYRILDIGCGDGIITNKLPADRDVLGVDISPVALKLVRRQRRVGSITSIPSRDKEFDLVMANDVLEHLDDGDFQRACSEMGRVASRYIIITVPFTELLDASRAFSVESHDWPHLNRHKRSLDFRQVRRMFPEFDLEACVFSGVTWEDELLPVERLKALCRALEHSPFSPARKKRLLTRLENELMELRKQQAVFLSNYPEEVDLLERRTEIICLYARAGRLSEVRQRLKGRTVELAALGETFDVSRNSIDFCKLHWYLASHLPPYSRLPYCFSTCEAEVGDSGALFRAGPDRAVTAKCGFFCPILPKSVLRLSGSVAKPGTLTIKQYDGKESYNAIKIVDLLSGPFNIRVEGFNLNISRYGILFELTFGGNELLLRELSLYDVDAASYNRTCLGERKEYLHRQLDGVDAFVSTRIYRDPLTIPQWFLEAEWISFTKMPTLFADAQSLLVAYQEVGVGQALSITELGIKVDKIGRGVQADVDRLRHEFVPPFTAEVQKGEVLRLVKSEIDQFSQGLRDSMTDAAKLQRDKVSALVQSEVDRFSQGLKESMTDAARLQRDEVSALVLLEIDRFSQELKESTAKAFDELMGACREIADELAVSTDSAQVIADLQRRVDDTGRRLAEVQQSTLATANSLIYLNPVVSIVRLAARARRPLIRPLKRIVRHVRANIGARRISTAHSVAACPAQVEVPRLITNTGLPTAVTMLVPDDRIDRRVLLQARSLVRHGSHVTVIAAPYPSEIDLDRQEFPEVEIIRIDTSRAARNVPDVSTTRLRRDRDWTSHYFYHDHFLAAATEHPAQVFIAHDLPVLPPAIAAADLLGAAVFYDAHELYPEQLHFGKERTAFYREVEAEVAPMAQVVTTVNRSIAEEMGRRYGIQVPIVLLNAPDAGDRAIPVPRRSNLRVALGLSHSRRIILYQGSLSFNRNLENLVAAMSDVAHEDTVLVLMGPGDEKRRELEEIARGRGLLGRRVLFHEAVPQSRLLDYSASADIGVIPYPGVDINTTYCTPNKLFEFMAAGLPIVANDLPELRRFVLGNGVGIVHPMDTPTQIAAAINRMLEEDLAIFRANLRQTAPKMIWSAQEPVLLQIYRDFMATRLTAH